MDLAQMGAQRVDWTGIGGDSDWDELTEDEAETVIEGFHAADPQ